MTNLYEIENKQMRLKKLLKNPHNEQCADCPERHPTWAILLQPQVDGGDRKMGVLCCCKCYCYHFGLGRDVCVVKNVNMASECKTIGLY